jgi:hypothetical protein
LAHCFDGLLIESVAEPSDHAHAMSSTVDPNFDIEQNSAFDASTGCLRRVRGRNFMSDCRTSSPITGYGRRGKNG